MGWNQLEALMVRQTGVDSLSDAVVEFRLWQMVESRVKLANIFEHVCTIKAQNKFWKDLFSGQSMARMWSIMVSWCGLAILGIAICVRGEQMDAGWETAPCGTSLYISNEATPGGFAQGFIAWAKGTMLFPGVLNGDSSAQPTQLFYALWYVI